MIQVQEGKAFREPIPSFLEGLSAEDLLDLSWTDPSLGVQELAWWPEVREWENSQDPRFVLGEEELIVDPERKVVVSKRSLEVNPDFKPPAPTFPVFTALEVLDFFTTQERREIVEASLSDVDLRIWYENLIAATFVTYQDPRVEDGLQALVSANLLTPERKAEIVSLMQPVSGE